MTNILDLTDRLAAVKSRIAAMSVRLAKVARWPAGSDKGGQFAPKGQTGAAAVGTPPKTPPKGAKPHPKKDDRGFAVRIDYPTKPSAKDTWDDPDKTATFTPGGDVPATLNGVAMRSWKAPTDKAGWAKVKGQNPTITDDDFTPTPGKNIGTGVVIVEPDGRVWLTKPTNAFGGYLATFPKGTQEPGLSMQANAIKEAWEETGLKVEITGVFADIERDTSKARYFTARRVGGTPADMGWESQALRLAPVKALKQLLNRTADKKLADAIAGEIELGKAKGAAWGKQPRWPAGSSLGGQWKAFDGEGLTMPPKIGSAANPHVTKKVQAAYAAAQGKDTGALDQLLGDLSGKAKAYADAGGKVNSQTKWAAQTHQYAAELKAQVAATPKAQASAAKLTGPEKLSGLKQVAGKPGGSNPGAIYEDKAGDRWLVKGNLKLKEGAVTQAMSDDRAKNEILASKLMLAAGVGAPEMKLVDLEGQHAGGLGVASRMITDAANLDTGNPAHRAAARADFAVQAWLGNYDAIGQTFDNTKIGKDGKAVCIDPGGALLFRAQGLPKADFGKDAAEFDSMRDPKKNATGATVYGSMTLAELQASAKKLDAIDDATIGKLVDAYGPGDAAAKAELTQTLIGRKASIMAKVGLSAPAAAPAAPVSAAKPIATPAALQPATLPAGLAKPTFASGFKSDAYYAGLVDTAVALHAAGDMAGLKAMTGKGKGTWSAVTTNSKGLVAFHQALVADLEPKATAAAQAAAVAAKKAPTPQVKAAAAAGAKAAPPMALPAKPPASAFVTPTNPSKKLLEKLDAIEKAGADFAAGKLTKDQALAAIAEPKFSTNTYGKKAAAFQASMAASIAGATVDPTGTQSVGVAIPRGPAPAKPPAAQATAAPAKPAKASKKPVFKPERISPPPSFKSWGTTGQPGPSGNQSINLANHDAVRAIQNAAKTGDIKAVQALAFPVLDKATGQPGKLVAALDHPSQWVKGYAQQAINEIEQQLNPPKKFRFEDGSPLKSLDAAYPIHKGALTGKGVQRLGYYVVLGEPGTLKNADVGISQTQSYKGGKLTSATYAKKAQALIAKMPQQQKDAVQSYTGSGYQEINKSLWSGNPTGAAKSAAEALKALSHDIQPGTILSRKINIQGKDLDDLIKATGKVLQEPAVQSTSISPDVWSGNVHIKMTVGPGVKGLYVGPGSNPAGGAFSLHASEKELLLPPNTRMLVQSVSKAQSGKDPDGFGNGSSYVLEVLILPT